MRDFEEATDKKGRHRLPNQQPYSKRHLKYPRKATHCVAYFQIEHEKQRLLEMKIAKE